MAIYFLMVKCDFSVNMMKTKFVWLYFSFCELCALHSCCCFCVCDA